MKDRYTFKVIGFDVVDGDTVDCCIDLGFSIHIRVRVRLAGIDAPEIHRKEQYAAGINAKKAVTTWMQHNQLYGHETFLQSVAFDGFGFCQGHLYTYTRPDRDVPGGTIRVSLNEQLIKLGFAKRSNGSTSRAWTDEELARIAGLLI